MKSLLSLFPWAISCEPDPFGPAKLNNFSLFFHTTYIYCSFINCSLILANPSFSNLFAKA